MTETRPKHGNEDMMDRDEDALLSCLIFKEIAGCLGNNDGPMIVDHSTRVRADGWGL
jgi:hypothetical protein